MVERIIPKVGVLPVNKIHDLGNLARTALKSFGGRVQWMESFVTEDKIYSIITAPDEATVREYSRLTNLPADSIRVIKLVADITTGE
jgi:hypothetical protein